MDSALRSRPKPGIRSFGSGIRRHHENGAQRDHAQRVAENTELRRFARAFDPFPPSGRFFSERLALRVEALDMAALDTGKRALVEIWRDEINRRRRFLAARGARPLPPGAPLASAQ